MKATTYQIDYQLHFDGKYENHTIRVKNCDSVLHAKMKLNEYLQKIYPERFKWVMTNTREDLMNQMFGI